MTGYAGKQLRISLNNMEIREEILPENDLRKYLGGVGYSANILYKELGKNIEPLSSLNMLIFATGPLTGNNIPGGGSVEICFKSPLTGGWGESRCGGEFGPAMKRAGYDFIIIEGKSKTPVYLQISNQEIKFRDASRLIGKRVSEKTKIIQDELNDDLFSIMCIGPAGENQVLFSTVMNEGRAAGRCGAGAVMGSKNLMAIAVKGSNKIEIASKQKFKNLVKRTISIVKNHPDFKSFQEHGTTGDIPSCDASGDWPTKNWQSNSWGKGEEIYKNFLENNYIRNNRCYKGCPVGCGRIVEVKEGFFKTPEHEGGEYESISAFTAFLTNTNVDAAINCTYLCNEYGIDTISTGAVIAFAMECYENGLLDRYNDYNLDLSWGNAKILPEIIKLIAERKGLGKLLGEGVMRASQELGRETIKFAIHGKGLEAPAHDPRSGKALAITYATANRGMCHIHPLEGMVYDLGKNDFGLAKYGVPDPKYIDRWDEEGKGKIVKILQDGLIIPDVLVNCKFMMYLGLTIDDLAEMISYITGWNIDGKELLQVGERVNNLQRLFNFREGFTVNDDTLPERMTVTPSFGIYQEEYRCSIKDFDLMLREYYESRDWNFKTGKPTGEKLMELGIRL